MLSYPQNGVPQAGTSLITKFMKPDGAQIEITGDQPGLRFVGPFFVVADGEVGDTYSDQQNRRIPDLPPLFGLIRIIICGSWFMLRSRDIIPALNLSRCRLRK